MVARHVGQKSGMLNQWVHPGHWNRFPVNSIPTLQTCPRGHFRDIVSIGMELKAGHAAPARFLHPARSRLVRSGGMLRDHHRGGQPAVARGVGVRGPRRE